MNPLINIIINSDGSLSGSGGGVDVTSVGSNVGEQPPPPNAMSMQVEQLSQSSVLGPAPNFNSAPQVSGSELPPGPESEVHRNAALNGGTPPPGPENSPADTLSQGVDAAPPPALVTHNFTEKMSESNPPGPDEFNSQTAASSAHNSSFPPGPG